MNPQPQTRRHPNGDCLRACLASILEIPILRIPDFSDPDAIKPLEDVNGVSYPGWYGLMQSFLASMRLQLINIVLTGHQPFPPIPFDVTAIFIGPHATGCKHAIVGKLHHGQFLTVFDPLCPEDDADPFVGGIEALWLLVPQDAYDVRRQGRALERILELTKGMVGSVAESVRYEASVGLLGELAVMQAQAQAEEEAPLILDASGDAARK